jgi:hypothetical protein
LEEEVAQLYTSLVRIKQAMNGGHLPPMTPLSEEARRVVSAAYTIGMGALIEDEERGLQCPIRGCGEWHHNLGKHVNWKHGDIGGSATVRTVLSLPKRVGLVSTPLRERMSAASKQRMEEGQSKPITAEARARGLVSLRAQRSRVNVAISGGKGCVNQKNWRDQCESQLGHKLIDLHNHLGRSPSQVEAAAAYGEAFVSAVLRLYGTWTNAKRQQGFEIHRRQRRYTIDEIVETFRVYYEVNGRLPSSSQAHKPTCTPLVPRQITVKKVLGVKSWPEAMQIISERLGIERRWAA